MAKGVEDLLGAVVEIAEAAGRRALAFYGKGGPVERKADDSPLTLADRASHQEIAGALERLEPRFPLLSEESPEEELQGRRGWSSFWLVDPLDGSKEFIKETGEFTVNIALVEGQEPVLGVIHVPVSGVTYTGLRSAGGEESSGSSGAWVEGPEKERKAIAVRRADLERLTVVASRDHAGPEVEAFLERLEGADITSMGSSLKFCLVAEGKADFYPRLVPTMEWDTGAAQCILEAAGGYVTDLEGRRLSYNKDDLRNASLIAFGDRDIDWVAFFSGRRG